MIANKNLHYTLFERRKVGGEIMGLHKDQDDSQSFSDFSFEEDPEELNHKKRVRQMLEERLERKRLKEELEDEFDDEFDWDDIDRK